MNILVTLPAGKVFDRHFPLQVRRRLEALGPVTYNSLGRAYTPGELREALRDADVALTHWGTPCFTAEVLQEAPRLRLLAHGAGSVAYVASDALYDRGVRVLSANAVMAHYVAEGVLGYILLGLRHLADADQQMHHGLLWKTDAMIDRDRSLFGSQVGLVGFGAVARELLPLLAPFGCRVLVYDPFVSPRVLEAAGVQPATLQEVMACPVVSLHAAQTPATRGMIDAGALACMPRGALLVNTARGSLVDEAALLAELESGRLYAVLDVYAKEPLPLESPLRRCPNAVLLPHMAANTAREHMTEAMIDDMERFAAGKPLQFEISREYFHGMTQG